ncbi:hypothetical protein [Neorhizobium galegae]|uniref:Uncharacterized protein n=1 Tax=Neorhizobium galegae bv. officinalis TaxID=323656 RepID=A0A0T7H1N6_NEOGA|nr:hypothetical protein [Neorhizobium galegae]CDZ53373.1 Hypothetical protein NGAL_HAMBI1189_49660 [Neorhizobium galegae bv. officinalis]
MRPEHVPVDAYRLLRELAVKKKIRIPNRSLDNDAAVGFLLTRSLAKKTEDEQHLEPTDEGLAVGRIVHAPPR